MGKPKVEIPEDRLEAYDRLIASHPDIERKGRTNPYTSLNGNMFSHMDKEGNMGLRLPEEEREAFMKRYDTGPYIQYGRTMRGYVAVPDDLLMDTEALKPYLDISYEYAKTLKPKPTTKKK